MSDHRESIDGPQADDTGQPGRGPQPAPDPQKPETWWRDVPSGGRIRAWPKGMGGNPSGVSKERLIAKQLMARLRDDPRLVERIADALIEGSCAGDARMMGMLLERTDGPVIREPAEILPMIEVIVQSRGGAARLGGDKQEGTPLSGLGDIKSSDSPSEARITVQRNDVQQVDVLRLPARAGLEDDDQDDEDDEDDAR